MRCSSNDVNGITKGLCYLKVPAINRNMSRGKGDNINTIYFVDH